MHTSRKYILKTLFVLCAGPSLEGVRQLFNRYKGESECLGKDEYEAFLCRIQACGCSDKWVLEDLTHRGIGHSEAAWLVECKKLHTTTEQGIDLAALTHLYAEYRNTHLESDFNTILAGMYGTSCNKPIKGPLCSNGMHVRARM